MRGGADGAARKRRVTEQLGEAVWAALELMVGAYGAQTEEADAEAVNESFDTARYLALRGEETVRETEVSRAAKTEEARERVAESGTAVAEAAQVRGERTRDVRREGAARGSEVRELRWRERVIEKETGAPVRGGLPEETHVRAGGEALDALRTAARVSEEIERDARRYDGALTLE